MDEKLLSIQEAAKRLKVSTKTLRRWEARGVLVPNRTRGDHRRYTKEQVENFWAQIVEKKKAKKEASTSPAVAKIFFFLIGAIILLGILVVSLAISYASSAKRLKRLEENEDQLYKKTLLEEKEIAKRAQEDYQKAIEEANARAKEIISQAGNINDSTKNAVTEALAQMSENEKKEIETKSKEFLTQYESEIAKINSYNIQMLQTASESMRAEINSHFEELKKLLATQTIDSHKAAEEKIKAEYDELEKELKKYREEQFQKIDSNIYELLLKISKVAFGYGLNFQEHQGLIIEALERAKTEGDLAI